MLSEGPDAGADWCVQSDAMPGSRLQAIASGGSAVGTTLAMLSSPFADWWYLLDLGVG